MYGPRGPAFGNDPSIISARSVMLQSVALISAAIAGRKAHQALVLLHVVVPDGIERDHVHVSRREQMVSDGVMLTYNEVRIAALT